jgi:dTDP-4-amino-4,6-dideoxygalactose transaminase
VSTRVRTPAAVPGVEHVYHQYVIRVASDERDLLMAHLRSRGVGVAIHYPMAVHRQAAYAGRLPVPHALTTTDRLVAEIVSLPMFPSLDDRDVAWVASALAAFDARPGGSAEVDLRRATPHRPA